MTGPTPSQQARIDNWSPGDPVQYPSILPEHWITVSPMAGHPPRCSCGVVGGPELTAHLRSLGIE